MSAHTPYLTNDQVHTLNEKHGWFAHADGQSDVSRQFAQDAIALHERIRTAAPAMLAMLKDLIDLEGPQPGNSAWGYRVLALIADIEKGAA